MNVRIKNDAPTSAQKKALKNQVEIEFNKLLDGFIRNVSVQIYYILHFKYGYGEKRLKDFALEFNRMTEKLKDTYEMKDDDIAWLCEQKLKEDGINLYELLNE